MGHYDSPLYMGHGGIQFWQKQDLNSTLFIPFTYPFYIPNHVICIFLKNCHFSKTLYFYQKLMKIASQKLVNSNDRFLTENRGISQTLANILDDDFWSKLANFDWKWRILTKIRDFALDNPHDMISHVPVIWFWVV